MVCAAGEIIACHAPDGTQTTIPFSAQSVQFDPAGVLYASTADNVYRIVGAVQTPLMTNTVDLALRVIVAVPGRVSPCLQTTHSMAAAFAGSPAPKVLDLARTP